MPRYHMTVPPIGGVTRLRTTRLVSRNGAVATRYEKTAACYLGNLHLATSPAWLSNKP